jgi:hypothetical protein
LALRQVAGDQGSSSASACAMNEERLVGQHAVEHLARVVVLIAAWGDRVGAGRRDPRDERLLAVARRRLHDVDEPAVLQRVRLVDDDERGVQAVGRIAVGTERLELRRGLRAREVGGQYLDARLEAGPLDERLAVREDDLGLLALRRDAVALGAWFAVEEHKVHRDDRALQTLPVLAGDLVVRDPEAPQARVAVHPGEERPEAELLVRFEHDRLPRPLAFVVPEETREAEEAIRERGVEPIREGARAGAGAVALVPDAGQPMVLAGGTLPATTAAA